MFKNFGVEILVVPLASIIDFGWKRSIHFENLPMKCVPFVQLYGCWVGMKCLPGFDIRSKTPGNVKTNVANSGNLPRSI